MSPKTRHHASRPSETFAYRGAEWHRKTLGGTGLMYDGDNVVADIDGSTVSRFYVTPMLDQNVSLTITGGAQAGAYWYSQDERSSVRTLTDGTGAVVARYDYTAFGEPVAVAGSPAPVVAQRYTYTGREMNPYSGNYSFRYRTYSAGVGAFTARDPLGYVDGEALYGGGFAEGLESDPMGEASRLLRLGKLAVDYQRIGGQAKLFPRLNIGTNIRNLGKLGHLHWNNGATHYVFSPKYYVRWLNTSTAARTVVRGGYVAIIGYLAFENVRQRYRLNELDGFLRGYFAEERSGALFYRRTYLRSAQELLEDGSYDVSCDMSKIKACETSFVNAFANHATAAALSIRHEEGDRFKVSKVDVGGNLFERFANCVCDSCTSCCPEKK